MQNFKLDSVCTFLGKLLFEPGYINKLGLIVHGFYVSLSRSILCFPLNRFLRYQSWNLKKLFLFNWDKMWTNFWITTIPNGMNHSLQHKFSFYCSVNRKVCGLYHICLDQQIKQEVTGDQRV